MDNFDDFLAEQLKDPEFKAEWDSLQPEFAAVQAEIDRQRKAETEVPYPFKCCWLKK